ncbi:hypothetical protein E2I00_016038 [Balaenoptera physalus]|uniref:Beta-arrestin-2 n=1 Tax=Balaenoptera physalus TaxID=9770 RepID=A0A643BLH9_BALPH|nr:hypothetical protein E2I00_016038 [Balaenoptera physalus]
MWGPDDSGTGCDAGAEEGGAGGRPRGDGVFKKSSPNCKPGKTRVRAATSEGSEALPPAYPIFPVTPLHPQLTVYLGKRDFVDHLDKVDPVDGVVLVDPDYLKDRRVFVTLTCAFRYGREDLDESSSLLRLGGRFRGFLEELNSFLLPQIPQNLPCSVTLQPGPEDTGKACGVDFEIRAFCAKSLEEKSHKRNSVRLVIRKVQFAPEKPGPQPSAETTRHFLIQYADICLFSTAQYKCPVAQIEQDDQVSPSSTFCKVYTITPLLSNNREKRGLALDGKLKHEDTNLASSTIVKEGANKEVLGILVSYRVKVKLVVSRGGYATDDDIVFEDFARLRLKGMKDEDYDDQFC